MAMPARISAERRQYGRLQHSCPICSRLPETIARSREEIAAELEARERFFAPRTDGWLPPRSLRDVTNVALGVPAAILRCHHCGVLVREGVPDEELFRDDRYDDGELASLHQTHALAFREKETDYRSLLPSGAHVVEVGSYVGGFLAAAAEWGWKALGTDIGCDTVRYCKSLGFDSRQLHLEDCKLPAESLDGVFVWNCFEQLPDPVGQIAEAARLLHTGGSLVIRVPDADFYLHRRQAVDRRDDDSALAVLAYNGLLGWPHRFGYDIGSLRGLVERLSFTFCRALRRPVIRPLLHAMRAWARAEELSLVRSENYGWIELTFRKCD